MRIKNIDSVLLLLVLILNLLKYSTSAPADPRVLSLLNVVRFQNLPCTAQSSTTGNNVGGTCFSSNDCTTRGGRVDGSCASGFGVCCVFTLNACGGTVTNNCTYITNPGAPGMFTGSENMCQYTFARGHGEICRIRLDFQSFEINGPSAAIASLGQCTTDKVTVTSTSRNNLPEFCGSLTGQHLYFTPSASGDLGNLNINFDTSLNNINRRWNIKVSRISCSDTISLPPDGCLQYFTGLTGSVKNYGFGTLLASQNYNSCIRREDGFCSVAYSVNKATNAFKLAAAPCTNSRVVIPNSKAITYCGLVFSDIAKALVPTTVTASSPNPHIVRLETPGILTQASLTGFNLNYAQVPC